MNKALKKAQDEANENYALYLNSQQRVGRWQIAFFALLSIFAIVLLFIAAVATPSPDVNKFCRDKVTKYFPEYATPGSEIIYDAGGFTGGEGCFVTYKINVTQRDGLITEGETLTKTFYLTEQKDKDYVHSGDSQFGYLVFCLSIIGGWGAWAYGRQGR